MKTIYTDNQKNITDELAEEVNLFNRYNEQTMTLIDTGFGVELRLGKKKITESCDTVVADRVRSINRSYGYNYLE